MLSSILGRRISLLLLFSIFQHVAEEEQDLFGDYFLVSFIAVPIIVIPFFQSMCCYLEINGVVDAIITEIKHTTSIVKTF